MPTVIVDILFWVAVFIGLFFVLRHFQNKKRKDDPEELSWFTTHKAHELADLHGRPSTRGQNTDKLQ